MVGMISFGEFAADKFLGSKPDLQKLRRDISDAAFVYLVRFDRFLTSDFVQMTFGSLARRIADTVGISSDESRRIFLRSFHDSTAEYFATGWDDVDAFVKVNYPSLLAVRRHQARILDIVCHGLGPNENAVRQVDAVSFEYLLNDTRPDHPFLLKVYADYCSVCRAVEPEFESAARSLYTKATFAALNGPRNPEITDMLQITVYPTILRFSDPECIPAVLTSSQVHSSQDIIAFALCPIQDHIMGNATSGKIEPVSIASSVVAAEAAAVSAEHDPDPTGNFLGQWAGMLRRQGIDELEALVHDRDIAIHTKIDNALRCGHVGCNQQVLNGSLRGHAERPVAILLGGGMGSGKSSVVSQISQTDFWKARGDSVVIVEADAFKQADPVFTVLASLGTEAAQIVHPKSLEGADALLLSATEARRDVVFDGTMAWKPFIDQTVEMLRDTDYHYKRGPGYVRDDSGMVSETYWVKAGKRKYSVKPYWIEIVGVTVDPALAVQRGITRTLVTGRGVPVRQQLKSHKLFTSHFEEYVQSVDAAYLFDMSTARISVSEVGGSGRKGIIASKSGILFPRRGQSFVDETLVIEKRAAYEQFTRRKGINIKAKCASELYKQLP